MTRRPPLLLAIVMLATILLSLAAPAAAQDDDPPDPGPEPGAIGEPAAPMDDKRVYDMANLLNNSQKASIEMDAQRLARHGVPNIVIVQRSAMTPEEADVFAADVRRGWGIETSPGADDGLVVLVTVNDTEERPGIFTTMSWGDNALPHFGVTAATSDDIQAAWLDRYIDEGHLYEGILFSLRRLIYHSIYDPAPAEPLGNIRAGLGSAMSVAGLALAIGAVALAGWHWTREASQRSSVDIAAFALKWAVPALAVFVFALSVAGHSGWGVSAALVLLGVAAANWVARDPRRKPNRQVAS
jgi:uncharacterized membrane protein YgcG